MTKTWTESQKVLRYRKPYNQPKFHDTPHEENADNVRYAIHHFGKPVKLIKYLAPNGYQKDKGLSDRGDATEFDVWMEIQPISGEQSKLMPEGERVEGMYEFWHDPYHPKQINNNPEPIYIRQSDSRFIAGDGTNVDIKGGHADLVLWMGEYYIVRKLENWSSSSHEDEHGHNTGYQWGLLSLWRDHQHLRHSVKNNISVRHP